MKTTTERKVEAALQSLAESDRATMRGGSIGAKSAAVDLMEGYLDGGGDLGDLAQAHDFLVANADTGHADAGYAFTEAAESLREVVPGDILHELPEPEGDRWECAHCGTIYGDDYEAYCCCHATDPTFSKVEP